MGSFMNFGWMEKNPSVLQYYCTAIVPIMLVRQGQSTNVILVLLIRIYPAFADSIAPDQLSLSK